MVWEQKKDLIVLTDWAGREGCAEVLKAERAMQYLVQVHHDL